MDRYEQISAQLARNGIAVLQHDKAVGIAGEGHACLAAGNQLVPHRLGDGEGNVLLQFAAMRAHRAGIMAAMASIDHDEGQAWIIAPVNGRQIAAGTRRR